MSTAIENEERKMSGVELIAAERQRQIEVEGWTPDHDDEHRYSEMAQAAACYAAPRLYSDPRITTPLHWPDEWDYKSDYPHRNNPINYGVRCDKKAERIRELVKAGALIAAEIDRLNRRTK